MTDNTSDLSDDIVPDAPRHTSFERPFAPWHKVRKEFVRKMQWNNSTIKYIERYLNKKIQLEGLSEWANDAETEIPEQIEISAPLKCLVIPGDDLLDIRSLHRDTESIKCCIQYLGFNKSHGSDHEDSRIHIAHNDVTSSPRVSKNSYVLHDQFQTIASLNSQAYRYLKEHGPFHVINLDLCDSLFPTRSGIFQSYYGALHRLCDFQMKEMAIPWLMFITTEIATDEVDESTLHKLCTPTRDNIKAHSEFADAIEPIIPINALLDDEKINCTQLSRSQLIDLFGIAIGKALLNFGSTADPKWKVAMLGSHIYGINEPLNVHMLSLAYIFNPVKSSPQDRTGISMIDTPEQAEFDEAQLATKILTAVKKISDIDQILSTDAELSDSLFGSSADLLEMAGYPRDKYIQWVLDGEKTSN